MASKNRANQIEKVLKVVKKHYKPAAMHDERTLLENLLLACCLENSPDEEAERVFQALSTDYFDWNEVRVSSIRELSEVMKPLNDPEESATRLKRVLQSVFETHYSFDLEPMKKQNIGQSAKQIGAYNGSTPFTIAYITQNSLGGHAIPINRGLLEVMRIVGVISDSEAAKGAVPGLERAVPKTKGHEIGSLLHCLGVEMHRSPFGPTIRKILLEIDPDCKARLPKRSPKKTPPPPPPERDKQPAAAKDDKAEKAQKADHAEKGDKKKKDKPEPAKPAAKKKPVKKQVAPPKKVVKKKSAPASPAKKKGKKAAAKAIRKKKPR